MVAKKKIELNVMFPDQKTRTAAFKAIAALAGVDEVKMEDAKVTVIGQVDPGKLSSEIKKVGLDEGCFGYNKGGKNIFVEIATVGKPPEKAKCKTCNQDFCQQCCKCHNPICKDCFKSSSCCQNSKTCSNDCNNSSCCCQNSQTCCCSSCSNMNSSSSWCHQQQQQQPPHYRSSYSSFAQVVDYPTCYHDGYGGGCSIL